MQEYLELWKRGFDFSGRTTRRGYWMAYLVNMVLTLVLGFVLDLIGLGFLTYIYSIAIFIPNLSIEIRRLRDAGKGWGWIFISLVPVVGWIILLVFLCQPSVAAPTYSYAPEYETYDY